MNVASLFTGIGGFDLGFEMAGMKTVMQVEQDRYCQRVLERWWPATERYEDVRSVGRGTEDRNGESTLDGVDVLCGGFPCQDLSIAGGRSGLAGGRSGLWFEFLRIIQEHNPEWVVIENVPGLLSSNKGRDFATVLSGLEDRGYAVSWRVLDSKYFGVGQQRRRVYIVGHLGSPERAFGALFPESESLRGDFETLADKRANGATFLSESTGSCGGGITMAHGQANAEILDNLSPTLTLIHEAPIVADPISTREGKTWTHEGNNFRLRNVVLQKHFDNVRFTVDIAPTLAGMAEGNYHIAVMGPRPRRLTPVECERLQGFPDGFTAKGSDGKAISDRQRYKQLGNAVTVNVVEYIGNNIMRMVR